MNSRDLIYKTVLKSCLDAGVKDNLAANQAQLALEQFSKRGYNGKKFNAFINEHVKQAKAASGKKVKK